MIANKIKKMKDNKSPGVDGISPKLLKEIVEQQDDLDKLVKCSEKWQILLNFGTYKCIHIEHGNMDEEKRGDAVLGRTTQE